VVFAEKLERPSAHCAGSGDLRTLAKRFSPERTAKATGIAPDTVRAIARAFAKAKSAAAYVRVGTCHQEHGTLASWLAWSLAGITGNIDREGGIMWTKPAADIVRIADIAGLAGHGKWKSRVRGLPETGGELPIACLAEEIETPGQGQIRALVTCAGNPVLSAPNGARLEKAIGTLEHMVSIDAYLNETTRHADVILPPCSPLERQHYDLALNAFAVENVAKWVDPPITPPRGSKDDAEIVMELGLRLRIMEKGPLGMMRRALARIGKKLGPETIVDLALRTGPYGIGREGLSVRALRERPHGVRLGPLTP
jgi:anaerobic selenocysteine-containing dehydrogenase